MSSETPVGSAETLKARNPEENCTTSVATGALGRPPAALANLLAQITPEQEAEWRQGTPDDWAMEAFNIAFDDVYGQPPLSGAVHLDAAYVVRAEKDVALQLNRAGVRLAAMLNKALGKQVAGEPQR